MDIGQKTIVKPIISFLHRWSELLLINYKHILMNTFSWCSVLLTYLSQSLYVSSREDIVILLIRHSKLGCTVEGPLKITFFHQLLALARLRNTFSINKVKERTEVYTPKHPREVNVIYVRNIESGQ